MDIIIGIAGLLVVAFVVVGVRRAIHGAGPASPTGASRTGRRFAGQVADQDDGDEASGSLVGHQLAQGHDGCPGDPRPGGHPDSAADLAYWNAMFDDDEDDDRPVY
jgi:hypothetical protein